MPQCRLVQSLAHKRCFRSAFACIYWSEIARAHVAHELCVSSLEGFPDGVRGKEPTCQCRRRKGHGFDPWRRALENSSVFRSQRDKLCVGFIDACYKYLERTVHKTPRTQQTASWGTPGMKLPSSRQVTMIIYLFFRLADGFPKSLLTRASKMGRHPLNT